MLKWNIWHEAAPDVQGGAEQQEDLTSVYLWLFV